MHFDERIRKFEYKFNDTDDQVIEYILEHRSEISNISIQNLANKLYTVPNTIMRLSKKLGYRGFSHLKTSLKDEFESRDIQKKNSTYHHVQKTFELIDEELMVTVAKLIKEAKHVLFFAVGDNADLCNIIVNNLRVAKKRISLFLTPP
ncbi:hypothetical protein RWE15_03960 [Virgibacillus halophilus]|uniref:HTH rpiR-type domain-containing protein n=1 Tax=Tigheibacillus halophilus TaxID=361280 RepID=A0ABU5C362_9BACI|nr:hypothetical protein [Virgibacillus halophilus]